jgi:uncharacterized membrane protein
LADAALDIGWPGGIMDWYLAFKFLHVAAAVIWIGGAFIMIMFGVKAERSRNDAELVGAVRQVAWAAERIYVPSSIATLVFGLITTWLGVLWADLWVILGLVGVAATIGLGILVLTPRAKKAEAGFAAGGATPAVVAVSRELLTIAKFDLVLLFTVVADMVLKPQLSDWALLVVMAIVLLAAAALWLTPAFRKATAAA